jgi:hypothetical protein
MLVAMTTKIDKQDYNKTTKIDKQDCNNNSNIDVSSNFGSRRNNDASNQPMLVARTTKIDKQDCNNKSNIDVSSNFGTRRINNASNESINIVDCKKRMNQVSKSNNDSKRTKVSFMQSLNERDNNVLVATLSNNMSTSNDKRSLEYSNTDTFVSSASSLNQVVDNNANSSGSSNNIFYKIFKRDTSNSANSKNKRRIIGRKFSAKSDALQEVLFSNQLIDKILYEDDKVVVYDETRKRNYKSDKIRCCGQIRFGNGGDPLSDISWEVSFNGCNHVMITNTHTIFHILNCAGSDGSGVFRIPYLNSEDLYHPPDTM